ncbi:hypothetical protein [Streptomyces sp. NPDC048637]|uniref:hypothetical protein n=1 Tax=Streptomyces sp. NPDC048637 TaxID=3155636 RepID=UPI003430F6B3
MAAKSSSVSGGEGELDFELFGGQADGSLEPVAPLVIADGVGVLDPHGLAGVEGMRPCSLSNSSHTSLKASRSCLACHRIASPRQVADLVAFVATLATGVVLILGADVPPRDVATTAASLLGAYGLWLSGRGQRGEHRQGAMRQEAGGRRQEG